MKDEIEYLSYTIDKFNEVIDDSKLKLSNLKGLYLNNYDAMLEEKFKLELCCLFLFIISFIFSVFNVVFILWQVLVLWFIFLCF